MNSYPFHYAIYAASSQLRDFAHKWEVVYSERKKLAITLDNSRVKNIIKHAIKKGDPRLPAFWEQVVKEYK